MDYCRYLAIFTVLLVAPLCNSSVYWKSASYFGTPVNENSVGTTIFDPLIGSSTPECFSDKGSITALTIAGCPYNTTAFFNTSGLKVILQTNYNLTRFSSFIPDCTVICTDSTGASNGVGLNIEIVSANTASPVWSTKFPTNITLQSLNPLQYIVRTLATDADPDKETSGRVSYSVVTVDGQPNSANNYLAYEEGGNSSRLDLFYPPPWSAGSVHTIVIKAQDNPRTGNPNSITMTMTLVVAGTASSVALSSTTTSTTSTTTNTESTTTTTTSTTASDTATAGTTAPSAQSSTSSDCSGIKLITCNQNWIWLILGVGVFLLLVGGVLVLAMYLTDRNRDNAANVRPEKRNPKNEEHNMPTKSNQLPQQRAPTRGPNAPPQHPNATSGQGPFASLQQQQNFPTKS